MGKIKIAVLGLGESLGLYEGGFDVTIGVNDIWQRVQTDYLVCVDLPERFTPERLKVINESRPKRFYTQVASWSNRPDYTPIELQHEYPNYVCQLDLKAVPKSLCSPFVACAIAAKYHDPKEIHVFGVDLMTHPNLKDTSIVRIKQHFSALKEALKIKEISLVIHGSGALKSL